MCLVSVRSRSRREHPAQHSRIGIRNHNRAIPHRCSPSVVARRYAAAPMANFVEEKARLLLEANTASGTALIQFE
jgi:hypothetical protein